ncbi:adenylate cyclase type 2-like isoform X1 [Portunus trituberculatus]|uniref:adenylate cyclase type 2-like isoform X1 n=1 Tax=Portunus trituberculatus TaxID=210409 RepID=UPI001E1CFA22|nr:adenylate cyclase type 2-like isoform X1 [Portunus trituberculatus]XP_045137607.1 adenylate cyclase type 2-like isoform X1 [Portunus trituberculatus]
MTSATRQASVRRVSSLTLMETQLLEFLSRMRSRQRGSMDSTASSMQRPSLDGIPGVSLNGRYISYGECEGPDVEVKAEEQGVHSNGRSSIGSMSFDASPRNSDDSQDRRFEAMARNSLSSLQQRRQSTASAFIREALEASTDDRNWSWSYLRERFRVKDLEDLFDQYQLRIHHAMLINYLLIQLCVSITFIITLFAGKRMEKLVPELTAHVAGLVVCVSLLVYVYNEHTFRQYPRLHIIMSGLVIITLFATDVAITLFFKNNRFPDSEHYNIKSGNMVYLLLVVYVFLPISHKWQTVVLGGFLTAGDLALTYYAISTGHLDTEHEHIVTKMCVDTAILLCINLLGIYWRFMSEVAFRRAFLDKRGSLESKFKVEAEKKQEEKLLLSILPKNIMQQVKADFRKMIEGPIFNSNPVTKNNPFPNLYINHHEMVSILYADIVNFTVLTTRLSPDQLVVMLNDLFGKFDDAAEVNHCLRIKLLGDCYYCVSGVPEFNEDHANNCVKVGLEMIDIIREVREMRKVNVDMRIGIHSGSVLSGLIGVRKWQFDVWSNAATIANHMEQTGSAGRIHVTHKTQELINDLDYEFEMSNARERDPLLQEEDIETFFLIPNQRRQKTRRVHHMSTANIKTPMSVANDSPKLDNFYEGNVPKRVAKVQLPHGVSRPSILNRRRSTVSETPLSSKRRTVVTDTALTNFQKIMVNSRETMEKEIETMPLRKTDQWFHPEGINPFFLNFTNREWELPLLRQSDPLYKYYIACALVVFVSIFVTQQSLMPGNSLGWQAGVGCLALLSVVMVLVWVATVHQHIVDPHNDLEEDAKNRFTITKFFYWSSTNIISSFSVRVVLYLTVCAALYTCAVINVVECEDILDVAINTLSDTSTSTIIPLTLNESNGLLNLENVPPPLCCDPWYFTYSTALTLLVAWTFFRMHFLLKFLVYLLAVSIYGYFIFDFAEVMYNHTQLTEVCPSLMVTSLGLSPGMGHLLFLIMIFLALHVLDRQMEYITRLDFQWKQQLEKEQKEAETTHSANILLLQNILPLHVAERYLNRQNATDELYHESFKNVSVIFASIPNYSKLYREYTRDNHGTECLRLLNEIISDFDMLTYQEPFQAIEKIKIVGSTYMAACGLQPDGDELNEEERSMEENVSTIVKFAVEMRRKLESFNTESLQELQLRVGINAGPVIAGVVGAHKPMYDIWGDTVNVASRMDYTGEMGKIHVTAHVGDILQGLGWSVECRGEIKVKGKGFMKTYYVDPDSAPKDPQPLVPPDTPSNNNNNHKHRKSSQDTTGERRRSSQLSLMSIKSFLLSQRGSLDITASKDADTHSTRSLPIYKPIKNENEIPQQWEMEGHGSAGTSPRSSFDSKDSGVVKGSYRPSYPSPVAEEAEWASAAPTSLQRDRNKSSDSTTQVSPGQDSLRRFNNNEVLKQLVNSKEKHYFSHMRNSNSFPDLSRMRITDPKDVRNSLTLGASRKGSKSSIGKKCPDVRYAQNRLLARSSPHTSITVDSDEVQSVWL